MLWVATAASLDSLGKGVYQQFSGLARSFIYFKPGTTFKKEGSTTQCMDQLANWGAIYRNAAPLLTPD